MADVLLVESRWPWLWSGSTRILGCSRFCALEAVVEIVWWWMGSVPPSQLIMGPWLLTFMCL